MQSQHTSSTGKIEFQVFSGRLGKIFSNLSIVFLILSFCGILSFVTTAFVILIGFTLIILSIGTIFVLIPNYWNNLMTASTITVKITEFFFENFLIFISCVILFSILSFIFLKLDKQEKHSSRIILSSIVIVITIISIIVFASGVVKWEMLN